MIDKGIYRSGFPKKRHFPFLQKIQLRSIVCLVLEDYPEANLRFLETIGAKLFKFGVAGNKENVADIPRDVIRAALYAILDTRNHPILIHCNKGKHRTGCLVGCYRKVQKWSMTAVFDEYRRFAHPKSRFMDQQFIETFRILPHPVGSIVIQPVAPADVNSPRSPNRTSNRESKDYGASGSNG